MNTSPAYPPVKSFNDLADELAARAEHLRPLWLMTADERRAMFARGEMTQDQQYAWAARCPREVPKLNGEFMFIAASTPEACVACPTCGADEVHLAADGTLAAHPDARHPFDPFAATPSNRPVCAATAVTPAHAVALQTSKPSQLELALAA